MVYAPYEIQDYVLHYVMLAMSDDEYLLWWSTKSRCPINQARANALARTIAFG